MDSKSSIDKDTQTFFSNTSNIVSESLDYVQKVTLKFYREILAFLLFFLVTAIIVQGVRQYYWSLENAPVLIKTPIAGSSASASLHRGNLLESVSDEDRSPNATGIFVRNIETVQTNGPVDFAVSFAIFPDNVTSSQQMATLFSIGENDFSVSMDMFHGSLVVRTRILYDYKNEKTGEHLRQSHQEVRIPHNRKENYIKMQTWNYVTISVSGRSIDMYINGVLAQYFLLKNVPLIRAGSSWNMFPGNTPFHGLLTDVRFITQSVSRTDARTLYYLFSKAPVTPFWWFFWFPIGKHPAL